MKTSIAREIDDAVLRPDGGGRGRARRVPPPPRRPRRTRGSGGPGTYRPDGAPFSTVLEACEEASGERRRAEPERLRAERPAARPRESVD